MKINDIDLSVFNVEVVSFSPSTFSIESNISIPDYGYIPISGEKKLTASTRELIINFDTEEDISNFTVEIMNESVLNIDDGYIYKIWLKNTPSIEQNGYKSFTATYNLYVIKQKEVVISSSKTIQVEGNIETPYIIELSSSVDKTDVSINEYTIKNLKANSIFVIDGIDKKVYYKATASISEFDNVNIVNFPMFQVGLNNVDISDDDIEFSISYYPTYM